MPRSTLASALQALRVEPAALSDVLDEEVPSANVPACSGLYAIYGNEATWLKLGLGEPPDERPLYIGKSESSLLSRDLKTHFASGRTGSSTVRRSFAALLRTELKLKAVPRNPAKPERFANYGLAKKGDERLTEWMLDNLAIATWPKSGTEPLIQAERGVLLAWKPPLNLTDVQTRWTEQVKAARKIMANQARASAATLENLAAG